MADTIKKSANLLQQTQPTATTPEMEMEEKFLPMLHGKATDSLAKMIGKKPKPNQINDTATLEEGELKAVLSNFSKLSNSLSVSAHKLLSVAIASFTELNHTGNDFRQVRTRTALIPLKSYVLACGYDVTNPDPKKAETALKNARKKINRDLNIIYNYSLSWKENIKKKPKDFFDTRIIYSKGIKNGYIVITFTPEFADYLIELPLTQYPLLLLPLDERNANAYNMGLKIAEQYSIDNNQIKGTATRLKVKTLLSVTDLPNINSASVKRSSWKQRIKEPFENALDILTGDFLELEDGWEYCKAKGEKLTNEEATNWTFDKWSNTLIEFKMKDAPDHTARLEARAEEKKAKAKKETRKKVNNAKSGQTS